MSLLSGLFNIFSIEPKHKNTLLKSDIKFSALIKSIQSNIVEANQSLECVGIKYIEQFFDKEPQHVKVNVINNKFNAIEKLLDAGETDSANKLLLALKDDVNSINQSIEGNVTNYRPKMMSFEMPVLKKGIWTGQAMTIPLFALLPITMPKVKELTFTSSLQNIQHEGDDVYVRFMQDDNLPKKNKKSKAGSISEVKILICPEQSNTEINNVITHYEQILRSS